MTSRSPVEARQRRPVGAGHRQAPLEDAPHHRARIEGSGELEGEGEQVVAWPPGAAGSPPRPSSCHESRCVIPGRWPVTASSPSTLAGTRGGAGLRSLRCMRDEAVESLRALNEVVERLRAPGGCPWDREQTHSSLRPYLLEETYELLEAIDGGEQRPCARSSGTCSSRC